MNSWYLSLWTPIAGGRWVGRKRERGREGNGEGGKGGEGREGVGKWERGRRRHKIVMDAVRHDKDKDSEIGRDKAI